MDVHKDFSELAKLFNDRRIEFFIVGGDALAFHGAPRFTGDMDFLVRPTAENAENVLRALTEFGFEFPNLTREDFQRPDNVVQLGVPPVRIDIMTSISGVEWEKAEQDAVPGEFGGQSVRFLGKRSYIKNKRAVGRHKDLADIEALGGET